MRLGIDVGGTNTDAVLLDGRQIVHAAKVPTTADVTGGIRQAIRAAADGHPIERIDAVIIGTTHFINAVTEARRLAPVAVVRLATPPQTLLPLVDWPPRLRGAVDAHVYVCPGGAQFDGSELNPLDEAELGRIAKEIGEHGITQVAVSSIFSPVNADPELRAAEILREQVPHARVTVSRDIGRIGLLERENATALNSGLQPLADHVISGFTKVIAEIGVNAPIFLSQNDGTLMGLDYARRNPIFTVASGPTNSMRGAAFLSGLDDSIVIDVGGTTTDVGMLRHGFPRESMIAVDMAGVRTNFRMPDVASLGLGGGSLVRDAGARLGPDSVGYQLTQRAIVFGGDSLTLTDVAVAAGLVEIGDPQRVRHLHRELVATALDTARQRLAETVDRTRLSGAEIPVVVVGGGGVLIDHLPGCGPLVRPEHGAVANAVGAAFAQVGGEVDRVYSLAQHSRAEALAHARQEATDRAIEAGGDPATVRVVDEEDVPLTHLPEGTATRVRVKAVGELRLEGVAHAAN